MVIAVVTIADVEGSTSTLPDSGAGNGGGGDRDGKSFRRTAGNSVSIVYLKVGIRQRKKNENKS